MKKEIEISDLAEFQTAYNKNSKNSKITRAIKEKGVKKACLNKARLEELSFQFNIEIPETKIYDQKNSYQCNIYAFLRVLKSIVQKENPTLHINQVNLSANYLDFYDKLEKVNTVYNVLVEQKNLSLEIINNVVNRYIGIYGTFHFCVELIEKYGIVPTEAMEEASDNYDAFKTLELLKMKIKSDAILFLNKTKKEKRQLKQKGMQEAYLFLAKTMGNPPLTFSYKKEKFTPQSFKEKIVKSNLEKFITVTFYPKKVFKDSYTFIPNVYLNKKEEIKILNIEKIRKAVLQQLQEGIAVWFSAEESTTLDYDYNILDTNTFKYKELLNIEELPKKEKIVLDIINYDHAMCITGALVENETVKQWKVDNSFGKHGVYKGQLIMTNTFFENNIIAFIIHEKYLK